MLFNGLSFLELIHRFLTFLLSCRLFSSLLCSCNVESLIRFFVDTLSVHIVHLALNVFAQVLLFDALPLVAVKLCRVQSVLDLFLSELSVLAHRVQAHNILNLLRSEGLGFDLRPVSIVSGVLLIVGFALFFAVLFLFCMLLLLLFLLFQSVLHAKGISDSVVVSVHE